MAIDLKDIGILTYHSCYNYGASLQAYALQRMIQNLGFECEFIDYQSNAMLNICRPFPQKNNHYKEIMKKLTRFPHSDVLRKRQSLFDIFTNTELRLSARCVSAKEVAEMASDYKCIVCGSDQTWNLDPAIRYQDIVYYLNFPKSQRRVSYATSFGNWVEKISQNERDVLPCIRTFDALSMREESGVRYLKSKGFDCKFVLDPTLLLNASEYNNILEKSDLDDYILLFSWSGSRNAVKIAKHIARGLGCKPICIVPPPRTMFSGIQRKLDVGPKEFLGLVNKAQFIVTDSFHGTVFSILYEKPFISVDNGKMDARRLSLLKSLELEKLYQDPSNINLSNIMSMDFSATKQILGRLREDSIEYLKKAIDGE